jgi:hypothetical protein
MLTGDEFRLLSQLLARLAADGDRAVKFAEYFEASIAQEQLRVAASAEQKPVRRGRAQRAGSAKD